MKFLNEKLLLKKLGYKKCKRCGKRRGHKYFKTNSRNKDGYDGKCIQCQEHMEAYWGNSNND